MKRNVLLFARTLLLLAAPLCVAQTTVQASAADIDGSWFGTLDVGAAKLRLHLKLTTTAAGLKASLFSLDQGNAEIPATATRDGQSIKVEMKSLGAALEGKFDKDFTRIDSTFSQSGASFPLVLTRTKGETAAAPPARRPQYPVRPYPYKDEEVSYPNPAAGGIKFAATLTIPPGKGPFPAVLLITGSGPQDRDETVMNQKPFLVLSDYLTRKGIVVLRADDRGVAKSEGNFATATTADFATDAEAGLAYLKTRPEVDHRKMGLIGHSEGGAIAPMVAARNRDVAFIVMLAGPGVPGHQIIVAQTAALVKASGAPPEKVEAAAKQEGAILDVVLGEKDNAAAQAKLKEQFSVPDSVVKSLTSAWYRYFLEYDPAVALRKVQCPVLALNGGKDVQVPPQLNLPAIRKALEEGGNKHFETVEMPGLNHLFQTANTGLVEEYSTIEETMSPAVLEKIAAWLAKQ
jgi:pimeloyl-ACP methyl ester carboxylesterase